MLLLIALTEMREEVVFIMFPFCALGTWLFMGAAPLFDEVFCFPFLILWPYYSKGAPQLNCGASDFVYLFLC